MSAPDLEGYLKAASLVRVWKEWEGWDLEDGWRGDGDTMAGRVLRLMGVRFRKKLTS